MRLAQPSPRSVPERVRSVATFAAVGVLATVTHVAIGLAVTALGAATPFVANIFAFLCAFAVSYLGHHRYSFRSTAAHRHAAPKFLAVGLFGLLLNQLIVAALVNGLGAPYYAALAVIVAVVPPLTYLLSLFWAFGPSTSLSERAP